MKLLPLLLLALLASSCTTINVTPPRVAAGGSLTITIDASRTVTTTPSVQADGNTVPLAP